ncbi:MAG: DUF6252 family protein [Bacteroidetes bacterium]|nr:DUF6252 family protein [Bacteroidota bacterium]
MKKLLQLGVVLIAIVVLSFGCKDKGTEASSSSTSQSPFSCKIDGADWSANSPTTPVIATIVGSTLNITATRLVNMTNVEQIILSISGFNGTGTYTLKSVNTLSYAQYTKGSTQTSYFTDNTNTGTVTITTYNTTARTIAGTFSFKAKLEGGTAIVNVTNGSFNATF